MGMYERTMKMLAERRETIPQIADGAGVSSSWLYKVNRGAITSPAVQRLQRVHDYLLSAARKAA